ncbi:hypothetical protein [Wenyingzhuangia marina]|uniref:DUF4834 domain-containing protein n=1 Tax=Wenyingzhuangia marina TaxID=1195760 RepID=A0A1M5W1W4_9FLAO|nr:hypothetical protein [Wenyingzhuangia marina]GGF76596.1 hypothetical protein GCM10011397_19470 [Wenyingzhuangia marina]SHH81214.1 hypothetical protein SAMN05444281_2118 [Wenyingzhuangia marina]
MQEAGFINFIRTLLIILAVYYIFKFFVKYVVPVLLVNYVQKKTGQQVKKEPLEKEGTVTIDKKPAQNNVVNDNVGEYVDYEEID